jgi:hypothetical protein
MTGFEPAALCSQSRCATKLRYIPASIVAPTREVASKCQSGKAYYNLLKVARNCLFEKGKTKVRHLGFKMPLVSTKMTFFFRSPGAHESPQRDTYIPPLSKLLMLRKWLTPCETVKALENINFRLPARGWWTLQSPHGIRRDYSLAPACSSNTTTFL